MAFLSTMANTISNPFTAFGLLVDNALISRANSISINLYEVPKYAQNEDNITDAMTNG